MEKEQLTNIVRRLQNGEAAAFDPLFNEFEKTSYYVAYKMLRDEEAACDVVQDTALQVYQKISTLKEPEAFFGWVKAITANLCKRRLEKGQEVLFAPVGADDDDSPEDFTPDEDDSVVPHEAFDNKETRRMIRELIDDLPDDQKLVIYMYYFQELKIREIADALEVSDNTVKSRLSYAKKKLEAGVRGYEKDGVKLYSAAPWLIIAALAEGASTIPVPQIAVSVGPVVTGTAAGTGAGSAAASGSAAEAASSAAAEALSTAGASAAKKAATKGIFEIIRSTVIGKVIAAVAAVAVAGAGITLASKAKNSRPEESADPSSTQQTEHEGEDAELLFFEEKESSVNAYGRRMMEAGYKASMPFRNVIIKSFSTVLKDGNNIAGRLAFSEFDLSKVITDLDEYLATPSPGKQGEGLTRGEDTSYEWVKSTLYDWRGFLLLNRMPLTGMPWFDLDVSENYEYSKDYRTIKVSAYRYPEERVYEGTYDGEIDRYVFDTVCGRVYLDGNCPLPIFSLINCSYDSLTGELDPFTLEYDSSYRLASFTTSEAYDSQTYRLEYDGQGRLIHLSCDSDERVDSDTYYYYSEQGLISAVVYCTTGNDGIERVDTVNCFSYSAD